jgi:hypothetical protein
MLTAAVLPCGADRTFADPAGPVKAGYANSRKFEIVAAASNGILYWHALRRERTE